MSDATRGFRGHARARGAGGAWQFARPAGSLINRLLAPTGLRLTRDGPKPATPHDLRTAAGDPIEAAYHSPEGPFVVDAPLHSCRAFFVTGFACTVAAGHPCVETLLAYGHGDCHAYEDSPLRSFYNSWQPRDAAEALGLPPEQAHTALIKAPAIGAVPPWEPYDPNAWMALWIGWMEEDQQEHGADLPYEHGAMFCGPVSAKQGQLDFDRLTRVYDSIRTNGYQRHSGADIDGYILCFDGISRIFLRHGHHRCTALAALGYEHAPIRLRPFIIHRDDVAWWPNVRSGLFTQEQALDIFDRIFKGRPPVGCNWTTTRSKQQE